MVPFLPPELIHALPLLSAAEGSAPSHGVGDTLLWMVIILVAAKVSGLVERIGMPSVLGELVIGVVLGNLFLIGIDVLEPMKEDPFIGFLAQLGVVILLFQVGLETNLEDMRKVGGPALLVAIIGVVMPFVLGTYIIGPWLLPGLSSNAYLFVGATLTATSVGITARVFRDLGRLQDPEARIILGAAVIDDVLGLIILAIVSAIVSVGEVSLIEVGIITGKAVIFLVAAVVAGQYFMDLLGKFFSRANVGMGVKFSIAISFGLLLAFLAEMIDLAPIVGAFAAGLILDPYQFRHFFENPEMVDDIHSCIEQSDTGLKSRVQKVMNDEESVSIRKCLEQTNPDIQHRFWEIIDYTDAELEKRVKEVTGRYNVRHIEEVIEPISLFLVPIFFVKVGMDVRLDSLFDLNILLVALGITIAAIAGKIVSGFAAGNVRKLVVGWGMVPRGEVGLIFAATGRALGVVTDEVYSVIVIMVIFSTLLPPPILSSMLKKEQREKEEPRKDPVPPPEAREEARPEPARPVRSVDELVQVAAQREEAKQEVPDEALTRQGIEERILRGRGRGLNLRNAYLGGLDLSYLNLSGANLSGANLENANLSGANLENANLESANLRRARLKRTNLHHTNLQDADLSGADLESAEVVDADLRGASLDEANLRWANLHGSRLQGASLQEVRFNRRTTWPAGFELLPAGRE